MCTCYIQSFKILASFCSWAGWFESYLVENSRRDVFAWCGSYNCSARTQCLERSAAVRKVAGLSLARVNDWKTLTVHPAVNGYWEGLRQRKKRTGLRLSNAVPKTRLCNITASFHGHILGTTTMNALYRPIPGLWTSVRDRPMEF